MGKSYLPSGYQIIVLDGSELVSGTAKTITPSTDDEKVLHEILQKGNIKKPLLIQIKNVCDGGVVSTSVPLIEESSTNIAISSMVSGDSQFYKWVIYYAKATDEITITATEY